MALRGARGHERSFGRMCQTATTRGCGATVAENLDVGAGHRMLAFTLDRDGCEAAPGQFAMVTVPGRPDLTLPRPFALLDTLAGRTARILVKAAGAGTAALERAKPGDVLRVLAPLGRPWRLESRTTSLLVAGGTGYAALHLLAERLAAAGSRVRLIWGAARAASFPRRDALRLEGVEYVEATDDGTCGFSGTSVACLDRMLCDDGRCLDAAVYGAGPVPMLRALARLAGDRGLVCQVSLEARMACGIGVCRGCVVNARTPHPKTGLMRRAVCIDGPVFDAEELNWEKLT
jgi:dihydroorotate dehydrogenase electron transfer subunit